MFVNWCVFTGLCYLVCLLTVLFVLWCLLPQCVCLPECLLTGVFVPLCLFTVLFVFPGVCLLDGVFSGVQDCLFTRVFVHCFYSAGNSASPPPLR